MISRRGCWSGLFMCWMMRSVRIMRIALGIRGCGGLISWVMWSCFRVWCRGSLCACARPEQLRFPIGAASGRLLGGYRFTVTHLRCVPCFFPWLKDKRYPSSIRQVFLVEPLIRRYPHRPALHCFFPGHLHAVTHKGCRRVFLGGLKRLRYPWSARPLFLPGQHTNGTHVAVAGSF